jgi:CheY-like chemotaxis protein
MANERVVVVDDEDEVLRSLLRGLESLGIKALGTTDPDEAYRLLEANQCDVLVVDFLLNGTTGLDLIQRVKRLRPRTKVILISGFIDHSKIGEEDLNRELQAGVQCEYYIPKPFPNAQLATAIKAAIEDLDRVEGDWQAIAAQYVSGARLNPDEIRQLNDRIKASLKSVAERHD